jgi:hypothetical protein
VKNNSKSYTDECDRLSVLEVQNCNTFLGRWFVEDGMLSTWVCIPEEKDQPLKKANLFCYAVEKLLDDKGQAEFLRQISSAKWIGRKGLKDAERALKKIKTKGEFEVDNNNATCSD